MTDPIPQEGHPKRWLILAVMCLSLVLVVAGVSSLNLALPSIRDALQPSNTELLWIVAAYGLVFAGLLLPSGAIGDRFGRRRALLTGLTLFTVGALLATRAGGPLALIASRSVMGIGAALIMPATLSIITVVFSRGDRGKAIATWAGFAGAGGALGVIAGGLLLQVFWWGSVFFINVPLALLALVAVFRIVPESKESKVKPLDPVGSLLSMAGLGVLLYAIIQGPESGWGSTVVLGGFAFAAVALSLFLWWELRTPHPMLNPRYFRNRRFSLGSLTISAAFLVMFGFFFALTLFFQFAQGHSPLAAAVRALPFAGTMILVAPRSAGWAHRHGQRKMVTLGLLTAATGLVAFGFITVSTHYGLIALPIMAMASGLAMLMPPSTEAIVSSLPQDQAGVGSAVNDTTREVGGALGIALLGSLLSSGYRSGLGEALQGLPAQAADLARDSVGAALAVARQIGGDAGAQLAQAARNAYVDGLRLAVWAGALILALTAAVIWWRYPEGSEAEERLRTGLAVDPEPEPAAQ
jgi:EmrB/QacA subfamily drug resistance transporter